jgi:hypothetical protein
MQHGSGISYMPESAANVLRGKRMIFGGTASQWNYIPQMLTATGREMRKMQVQAHVLHTAACRFWHSRDINRTHVVNEPFGDLHDKSLSRGRRRSPMHPVRVRLVSLWPLRAEPPKPERSAAERSGGIGGGASSSSTPPVSNSPLQACRSSGRVVPRGVDSC